jgi:hypothetical protein
MKIIMVRDNIVTVQCRWCSKEYSYPVLVPEFCPHCGSDQKSILMLATNGREINVWHNPDNSLYIDFSKDGKTSRYTLSPEKLLEMGMLLLDALPDGQKTSVANKKAKWVLVHDDGECSNGKLLTPLVDGYCPACDFHPDMQSTSFILYCPNDDGRLDKDGRCYTCGKYFDKTR